MLALERKRKIALSLLVILLINIMGGFLSARRVQAAPLTEAGVLLYRMAQGTAASSTNAILVVFKPATASNEDYVAITVTDNTSSGFTVDGTAANITTASAAGISFNGESVTNVAMTGSAASSVSDGGSTTEIKFTISTPADPSVGTLYGFLITGGITNPAGSGEQTIIVETEDSGNATIDTKNTAVDIVGASADQVTVTATVPATFNFNVQDTSIALGTLSSGSVSINAMSPGIDVDTNAANGYTAWIRSEGGADTLASATAGDSISSTDTGALVTCSAGTECYVIDVNPSGGGTATTEYDGNGSTTGGVIDTAYEPIVTHTAPVDSATIVLTAIVAISPTTAAASDYTDTWQVVGAGNF